MGLRSHLAVAAATMILGAGAGQADAAIHRTETDLPNGCKHIVEVWDNATSENKDIVLCKEPQPGGGWMWKRAAPTPGDANDMRNFTAQRWVGHRADERIQGRDLFASIQRNFFNVAAAANRYSSTPPARGAVVFGTVRQITFPSKCGGVGGCTTSKDIFYFPYCEVSECSDPDKEFSKLASIYYLGGIGEDPSNFIVVGSSPNGSRLCGQWTKHSAPQCYDHKEQLRRVSGKIADVYAVAQTERFQNFQSAAVDRATDALQRAMANCNYVLVETRELGRVVDIGSRLVC